MTEELLKIRKDLSKKLKNERFEHTIGVMYTAASLAMCYGSDIQKALTAGLLHDCGKYCSAKEQIKLCRKYDIQLTESELEMPALVHAKLGAYLARHEYKVKDQDVLDAGVLCKFHNALQIIKCCAGRSLEFALNRQYNNGRIFS